MHTPDDLPATVKRLALEAGFARAATLALPDAPGEPALADWLARGFAGDMLYLHRHLPLRLAPVDLVAGARGVICLAAGYAPARPAPSPIARYARGRDYHKVLKKRCRRLIEALTRACPGFEGRAFVDIGPVGERHLAASAGLGWIGRNGCLFVPGLGSYVLLAEIFCNQALPTEGPIANGCGDCRACRQACPTGALGPDGCVDARKCISYLTIEHKGEIAPELASRMGDRLFGCDVCQEACPHNRSVLPGDDELTVESRGENPLAAITAREVLAWGQEEWSRATEGSAVRRASRDMLIRNARIALENGGG